MTSAPWRTAKRMPAVIAALSPSPRALRTRTGMIFAPYASPVTPRSLCVLSPIVLATWVPWPFSSCGNLSLVHEVVARHEVAAREVGRPAEAPAVRVGDAGVEHRDGGAAAARMPEVEQVLPGVGRVDARGGEEVPLQVLPAAVAAGAARVARDEGGQVRAGVRRGGRDLGAPPQLAHRVGHALAVADGQHARARGEGLRSSDAGRALHGRLLAPARAALVADDHLAGRVGRGARGLGAGRGGHRQHGGGDEGSDQAGRLQHEVAATVPPRAVRLTYNIVGTPKLRDKP